MGSYYHSVRLIENRCKGCVSCTKHCPTEAIRVRHGKAKIMEARCIDCGECIRVCPTHAKTAETDHLGDMGKYKFNVALPAPSLYAQFGRDVRIDDILYALIRIGFDDVFEVAQGAEIVSLAIRDYIKKTDIYRPIVSSACPAVVRLIQVRYPEIIEHLLPYDPPVEIAARIVRERLSQQREDLKYGDIGIWFITPCAAKMTAVRQPLGRDNSFITGTIAISQIYGEIIKVLRSRKEDTTRRHASWVGVGWALAGGETTALEIENNTLVVHGIHNVTDVLEQLTLGKLRHVDYIEALACTGGCIGGPLTVQNRYVAESNMKDRAKRMQEEDRRSGFVPLSEYTETELGVKERRNIDPRPILRLDEDIHRAMDKVEAIEKTLEALPGLDCGSCGSPNCKALAEDIVQGEACETDCVFKLRERVHDLAKEMVGLAQRLPPSLEQDDIESEK